MKQNKKYKIFIKRVKRLLKKEEELKKLLQEKSNLNRAILENRFAIKSTVGEKKWKQLTKKIIK